MVFWPFRCHGYGVVLIVMLKIIICFDVTHAVDHAQRIRQFLDDGYHAVEIVKSEIRIHGIERTKRSAAEHLRYARAVGQTDGQVEMTIHGSNGSLELVLRHAQSVFRKNMVVSVVQDNFKTSKRRNFTGCHLTGSLKSNPDSTASFSFCNTLKGLLSDGPHSYWIETVDDDTGEAVDNVLVARKSSGPETKMCKEEQAFEHNHDVGRLVSVDTKRHTRVKRETETFPPRTLEMAIILDELYIQRMKDGTGIKTNEDIIHHLNIRMNAAQAEWSKLNVTLDVARIELWETNQHGYTASSSLSTTLSNICNAVKNVDTFRDFDHIHLFSGVTNTLVAGKATTGGVCMNGHNCAVSTMTELMEFTIVTHEIGHILGMSHDVTLNCVWPNTGIMGTNSTGWSTCSINSFQDLMSGTTVGCLGTDNIEETNDITLTEEWPGLSLTDDEVCQLRHGESYKHRNFQNVGTCSITSCVNMDVSSDYYGLAINYPRPPDGRYCGTEKVCSSTATDGAYPCISWADTGLKESSFVTQAGGWSEFSALSECSRTCGTGLRVKTRTCTNPKPKNSPPCDGNEYYAEICNTQRCQLDEPGKDSQITQRASEVCAHIKSMDFYAALGYDEANFTTIGSRFFGSSYGQCEVKCSANFRAPSFLRYGLMSDGTPCTVAAATDIVEVNSLPMSSGKDARCVRGYCYEFGCDGKTDPLLTRDFCGVCGGDNSTCQIISGTFTDSVSKFTKATVVTVPATASNIQAFFTYNSMRDFDLQLYSKDNIGILGNGVPGLWTADTGENPSRFANADWRYKRSVQFLASSVGDQLSESVVIKLYNTGRFSNTGVTYMYAMPVGTPTCSGTCQNGGTWNQDLCSCTCTTGYYGETCDSTCRRYCKNDRPFTENCQCDCLDNMYGSACECRYPFTGLNCGLCKMYSCQNGGTFNETACRCACPPGFGDIDCSSPCEDAIGDTALCQSQKENGLCDLLNVKMETECYMTCGHCDTAPDTTSTTSSSTTSSSTTSSSTSSTTSTTTSTTSSTTTSSTTSSTTSKTTTATSTSSTAASTTLGSVSTTSSTSATTTKGSKMNILLAGMLYTYALHFWI